MFVNVLDEHRDELDDDGDFEFSVLEPFFVNKKTILLVYRLTWFEEWIKLDEWMARDESSSFVAADWIFSFSLEVIAVAATFCWSSLFCIGDDDEDGGGGGSNGVEEISDDGGVSSTDGLELLVVASVAGGAW